MEDCRVEVAPRCCRAPPGCTADRVENSDGPFWSPRSTARARRPCRRVRSQPRNSGSSSPRCCCAHPRSSPPTNSPTWSGNPDQPRNARAAINTYIGRLRAGSRPDSAAGSGPSRRDTSSTWPPTNSIWRASPRSAPRDRIRRARRHPEAARLICAGALACGVASRSPTSRPPGCGAMTATGSPNCSPRPGRRTSDAAIAAGRHPQVSRICGTSSAPSAAGEAPRAADDRAVPRRAEGRGAGVFQAPYVGPRRRTRHRARYRPATAPAPILTSTLRGLTAKGEPPRTADHRGRASTTTVEPSRTAVRPRRRRQPLEPVVRSRSRTRRQQAHDVRSSCRATSPTHWPVRPAAALLDPGDPDARPEPRRSRSSPAPAAWARRRSPCTSRTGCAITIRTVRSTSTCAAPATARRRSDDVAARLLRELGVDAAKVPADAAERDSLYRSVVAERRLLVVFDDVRDTAHVRPLIPGSPTCGVLITSRNGLATLPVGRGSTWTCSTTGPATALFTRVVGAERAAAEPDAVADVLAACAGLPLAIRIAAARLAGRPTRSIRALADRLADARARLDQLQADDLGVRATFTISYTRLAKSTRAAEALRRHRPVARPGYRRARPRARCWVSRQVSPTRRWTRSSAAHLLERPAPDRYRLHDLLQVFARERSELEDPPADRDVSVRGWSRGICDTATNADTHLRPHRLPVPLIAIEPGVRPLVFDDYAAALDGASWSRRT